jgi:hypothetical protein
MVPDLFRGIFFRLPAIGSNGVFDLVCDSRPRCAGSKNHHSHIRQLQTTHVKTSRYRCEGHTAGSLHVVVEAWNFGSVFIQDPSS